MMIEEQVKSYVIDRLVPAVHEVLFHENLAMFKKWQGSCCRQVSVCVAAFLDERFGEEYEWQVWHGLFRGLIRGVVRTYDHAWVWGQSKQMLFLGRFVDVAHRKDKRLWVATSLNKYPAELCQDRWREIKRERLYWGDMLRVSEYFTDKKGIWLYQEAKKLADSDKMFDESRYEKIRPVDCD